MSAVGLGGQVQDQVFRVLAALLHLGNVTFQDVAGDTSDACQVSGWVVTLGLRVEWLEMKHREFTRLSFFLTTF